MLVPFQVADTIGDRFLALLQKYGIEPPVGSSLESQLLSVAQLVEIMKNPALAQGENQPSILRCAAGLHDLAAKVLSVETIPEFEIFLPHLRLIGESKSSAASVGQNAASEYDDDTARKMAELYVGCLAAHAGTNIVLDSPTNSTGDNPDIIFTVEERCVVKEPRRWALAVKTIASRQGQTIFERIKEGANQIDDPRCLADHGMVVVNAKNSLDHDALWNIDFPDLSTAMKALAAQLDQLAGYAAADRPQVEWDRLFMRKVVRPILFLGQSLVRLPTPAGQQTPTSLKMLKAYGAGGTLDPVGHGLAFLMNDHMQNIISGIPGNMDANPR